MTSSTRWLCDQCGSDRVLIEMSVFVDPNNPDQQKHWGEVFYDRQEQDYAYCAACEERTGDGESRAKEVPVQ